MTVTTCDFCGSRSATLLYTVPEENIPLLVAEGQSSAVALPADDGLWAACATCASFVDRKDMAGLLAHVLASARARRVAFVEDPLFHALLIGKYAPLMVEGTSKVDL
ncbi:MULTISPECIES: hypothetical protein [Streptomyces]|uniref:hypothetical protein n=1 Tax=Streptomyces TaxID=1883 RepID=UPI002E286A64|nr:MULTISPECIES: hypothetical protein [Streptomyces]